ncbi:MAG: hypothetical protein PUI06_06940 [Prevotella sp.]|nr:hypothetical protein [Prevotella sp.]MDY5666475.1 hypothetical protein [Alloprevotella sp.]
MKWNKCAVNKVAASPNSKEISTFDAPQKIIAKISISHNMYKTNRVLNSVNIQN